MSNDVVVQNQSTAIALPEDLMALFGGVKSNVAATERVNSLRISGKVWKTDVDGEVKKLVTMVEGEEIPVPMVKVIIVNQNPKRARALFEGPYDDSNSAAPVCWSSDCVTPDTTVQEPKAKTCEECKMSKKQVKHDDSGKEIEVTPCKFNKRIAVVQHNRPDSPALRLQLAITSLWEPKDTAKAKEAQGWYAFDSYCKNIANMGIPHTAACRTIMKFDSDAPTPKVLFKYDGLINKETAAVIVPRIESEEVVKVLGIHKKDTTEQPVQEFEPAQEAKPVEEVKVVEQPQKAAEPVVEEPKAEVVKPAKAAPKKAEEKKPEPPKVSEADSLEDVFSWDD